MVQGICALHQEVNGPDATADPNCHAVVREERPTSYSVGGTPASRNAAAWRAARRSTSKSSIIL